MDLQGRGTAVAHGRNRSGTGRRRRRLKGRLVAVLLPVLSQASTTTPPTLVSIGGGGSQLGDGGPAAQAALSQPVDVAVDHLGNTYIADRGHARVRKISADGTITTVAGFLSRARSRA